MGVCTGDQVSNIDLYCNNFGESNLRTMPVESNLLQDVSITAQAGKRQDLFWLVIAFLVTVVVILTSFFRIGKRKKR